MPCYRPIYGYRSRSVNPTGKRSVVFSLSDGYADRPVTLPCGRCIGCRLERARQWSVRCMHEAKLHASNCFVTLTYDNASVPHTESGRETLNPRDFVLFMKKLRAKWGPGIRFFQCGEYGDQTLRPHHHVMLFNHWFKDSRIYNGVAEQKLWESKECERLWSFGRCVIGQATFESAGYIARYSMKKLGKGFDKDDPGEDDRVKEYLTMSRRPGIGHGWLVKFRSDVYPSDQVVVNGVPSKPPRFYDNALEKIDRGQMLRVKRERLERAEEAAYENAVSEAPVSSYAREVVKTAAVNMLVRKVV